MKASKMACSRSNVLFVQGMGAYAPLSALVQAEAQIKRLEDKDRVITTKIVKRVVTHLMARVIMNVHMENKTKLLTQKEIVATLGPAPGPFDDAFTTVAEYMDIIEQSADDVENVLKDILDKG